MKPRRLHSETITSRFMGSPRPRLSLALPRSWAHRQARPPEVGSSRRTSRRNLAARVGWPMSRETWVSRRAPISLSLLPMGVTSASSQRAERSRSNAASAVDEAGTGPPSSRAHASPTAPPAPPVDRAQEVEVVSRDQPAPVRAEEAQPAEVKEPGGAGDPRPGPGRGLGDAADLAEVA